MTVANMCEDFFSYLYWCDQYPVISTVNVEITARFYESAYVYVVRKQTVQRERVFVRCL